MKTQGEFKQTEIGEIPNDWKIKTIYQIKSSLKNALSMGPFGSNIKKEFFVKEGVPIIRGNNLTSYRFLDEDFVYLTEKKADELKSSNCHPGDIVLTHRGTLGQIGIIPRHSNYKRYVISQSGMKLSCDESQIISEFVFYFLKSIVGQRMLLRNTSQTGVPAIAQPLTSLKNIPLPVPQINEQKRIIKIFEDLNDKIDLLQSQNKTLEIIGSTIFKHWFVDFEFPGKNDKPYKSSGGKMIYNKELDKEIPVGWDVKPIDVIADFLNGLALQKFPIEKEGGDNLPVIKIRELRQGITESSDKASPNIPKEYVVNNGDILFSWSGSLEIIIWTSGRGALNQHLFKVTSKDYPKWFYYYWILQHLPEYRRIAEGKATTMGHIQRRHLTKSLVLVSDNEILERSDKILSPIIKKIIQIKTESKNLALIRDLLLPKLMSGNIRVPIVNDT